MKKEAKKCIKYYIDNIQSEKYRVYLSAKKKEGFKNHEEYVKKYKPEWIKRTDFYEPDFMNNPVPVSLLSGDRKPQIRFLGNHPSGSGNLYHKSFRM